MRQASEHTAHGWKRLSGHFDIVRFLQYYIGTSMPTSIGTYEWRDGFGLFNGCRDEYRRVGT